MNDAIKETLAVLPNAPGVYIMHDAEGKVIYVGKAVILKNRVRSYFRPASQVSPKVRAINAHVASIETIVTASEMEALILECNLIKKYRPRYNIDLKDDKTYPYLKVTVQEAYPRMVLTRRVLKDGARYYGPYADAGALRDTMKLIRTMFPLRHCRNMNVKRPCLQYHLHRCLAPCTGKLPVSEYRQVVDQVLLLLDGKVGQLEKELKEKMYAASDNMEFEAAANTGTIPAEPEKTGRKAEGHHGQRRPGCGGPGLMTAVSVCRCSSSGAARSWAGTASSWTRKWGNRAARSWRIS
jgi:excinuclease ABC subunit C